MDNVEWKNAKLAKGGIKEEVLELRQQPGKRHFSWQPEFNCSLNETQFN